MFLVGGDLWKLSDLTPHSEKNHFDQIAELGLVKFLICPGMEIP